MVIVDEATGLARTGRIKSMQPEQQHKIKTSEVEEMYRRLWEEPYGPPERIRYDEEGANISREMGEIMSEKGILLEPIPGAAHWQNGKAERMIKTIF